MRKNHISKAMLGLAIGIAAGALGAHSLEKLISVRYVEVWETAWRYWTYSMLGLMALVSFVSREDQNSRLEQHVYSKWGIVNVLWLGTIIFSGTLGLIALNEVISEKLRILGAVTPVGGIVMIYAWVRGAWVVYKHQKNIRTE
jgi:uncharacterized membrane protein YgdD (TMEM256/DUF423 family)